MEETAKSAKKKMEDSFHPGDNHEYDKFGNKISKKSQQVPNKIGHGGFVFKPNLTAHKHKDEFKKDDIKPQNTTKKLLE